MSETQREQTLREYVESLPVHHKASRQYREIIILLCEIKMLLDHSNISLSESHQDMFDHLVKESPQA